ncbi:MAG: glycosyltransferase, partial [Bacteroidetes bacterium]|nr:glycosyltransferase [Bacteroidota bacterium]
MQSDQMQNPSNRNVALSVVIVNYNLAREIENCLTSLLQVIEMMKNIEYEIIIVDNNSPDRNIVQTENKSRKDNIHFYYLEENLGFGKGCNYGFTKASGKYIWFLNPDTIIKEDIFSQIISQFEQDKSIGIIGPKQQFSKPCFDFSAGFSPNILFEIFNLLGIG